MALTRSSTAAVAFMGALLIAGAAGAQQAAAPNMAPRDTPTQPQTGTISPIPTPGVPGVAPTSQRLLGTKRPSTSNTTPGNAPTAGASGSGDTAKPPSQTTPR